MKSSIILYGIVIFLTCLLAHVLMWRLKRPKKDALALFVIFLIIPPLFLTFLFIIWPGDFFLAQWEMVAVLLLHVSISAAYIATYPAAQADSPSLKIVLYVAFSMPVGLNKDEILGNFNNDILVNDRVGDLLHSGLIKKENGDFALTKAAKVIVKIFTFYRGLLSLPVKGG